MLPYTNIGREMRMKLTWMLGLMLVAHPTAVSDHLLLTDDNKPITTINRADIQSDIPGVPLIDDDKYDMLLKKFSLLCINHLLMQSLIVRATSFLSSLAHSLTAYYLKKSFTEPFIIIHNHPLRFQRWLFILKWTANC